MVRAEPQRQVTDRWTINFIGRYGLRFCGEPLRSVTPAFGGRFSVVVTLASWSTITAASLYERGLAVGRDDPQTDLGGSGHPPLVLGV